MSSWVKLRREGGGTPEPTPLIAFRRGGVAFNAEFVRVAKIEDKTRVSVSVNPASLQIGFKFHDDSSDADSYALTTDGGSRDRGHGIGRWAQAGTLVRLPWVAAIARIENARLRRFKPTWSSVQSMWIVTLCPAFEVRASAVSEIPSIARGIYRYRHDDGIVYIGHGQIRSRLNAPERAEWDFDTIEYSLIEDEVAQRHWETYWLDKFVEQHGRLPFYNRIGGVTRPVEKG